MATKRPKVHPRRIAIFLRSLADFFDAQPETHDIQQLEADLAQILRRLGHVAGRDLEVSTSETARTTVSRELADDTSVDLSITEYGVNIFDSTLFSSRKEIVAFAEKHGMSISSRDSKQKILHRLLSRAELRNMDLLVRPKEAEPA
jgi:hypothetical protein